VPLRYFSVTTSSSSKDIACCVLLLFLPVVVQIYYLMYCQQIYSEYVQACSALQSEKEENKRLSDYLDRILHVSCTRCVINQDYTEFISVYCVLHIIYKLTRTSSAEHIPMPRPRIT